MPGAARRCQSNRFSHSLGFHDMIWGQCTADVIAQRGVLEQRVDFIGRPLTRDDLARKVREILDSPDAPTFVMTETPYR